MVHVEGEIDRVVVGETFESRDAVILSGVDVVDTEDVFEEGRVGHGGLFKLCALLGSSWQGCTDSGDISKAKVCVYDDWQRSRAKERLRGELQAVQSGSERKDGTQRAGEVVLPPPAPPHVAR